MSWCASPHETQPDTPVTRVPYRTYTEQLSMLPLGKVYKYIVVLFMYNIGKNMLLPVMKDTFTRNYEIHKYKRRPGVQF